jgi:rubrerythrin
MSMQLTGASVWEQEIYDHLVSHVEKERETLIAYAELAERTESPGFAYLAKLILDDERRHHRLLAELAESIRTTAELSNEPRPIPSLGITRDNRDEILEQTERFLALEQEDNRALKRLARNMHDVRDTTMWVLVLRLIQDDNAKHRRMLSFIRDRAREKRG